MDDKLIQLGSLCYGPMGCEDRKFDDTKADCQECYKDAMKALTEEIRLNTREK